jgi:hypothetical protein
VSSALFLSFLNCSLGGIRARVQLGLTIKNKVALHLKAIEPSFTINLGTVPKRPSAIIFETPSEVDFDRFLQISEQRFLV